MKLHEIVAKPVQRILFCQFFECHVVIPFFTKGSARILPGVWA